MRHVLALVRTPWPELEALISASPMGSAEAPAWADAVADDLRCLAAVSWDFWWLGDPGVHSCQWRSAMWWSPVDFNTSVRMLRTTECTLIDEKRAVVVNISELAQVRGPALKPQYVCDLCPPARARGFNCNKALATHKMRSHGHRKTARRYVLQGGTKCPACDKEYGSYASVLDHLEYRSKRCRAQMLGGNRAQAEFVPGAPLVGHKFEVQ